MQRGFREAGPLFGELALQSASRENASLSPMHDAKAAATETIGADSFYLPKFEGPLKTEVKGKGLMNTYLVRPPVSSMMFRTEERTTSVPGDKSHRQSGRGAGRAGRGGNSTNKSAGRGSNYNFSPHPGCGVSPPTHHRGVSAELLRRLGGSSVDAARRRTVGGERGSLSDNSSSDVSGWTSRRSDDGNMISFPKTKIKKASRAHTLHPRSPFERRRSNGDRGWCREGEGRIGSPPTTLQLLLDLELESLPGDELTSETIMRPLTPEDVVKIPVSATPTQPLIAFPPSAESRIPLKTTEELQSSLLPPRSPSAKVVDGETTEEASLSFDEDAPQHTKNPTVQQHNPSLLEHEEERTSSSLPRPPPTEDVLAPADALVGGRNFFEMHSFVEGSHGAPAANFKTQPSLASLIGGGGPPPSSKSNRTPSSRRGSSTTMVRPSLQEIEEKRAAPVLDRFTLNFLDPDIELEYRHFFYCREAVCRRVHSALLIFLVCYAASSVELLAVRQNPTLNWARVVAFRAVFLLLAAVLVAVVRREVLADVRRDERERAGSGKGGKGRRKSSKSGSSIMKLSKCGSHGRSVSVCSSGATGLVERVCSPLFTRKIQDLRTGALSVLWRRFSDVRSRGVSSVLFGAPRYQIGAADHVLADVDDGRGDSIIKNDADHDEGGPPEGLPSVLQRAAANPRKPRRQVAWATSSKNSPGGDSSISSSLSLSRESSVSSLFSNESTKYWRRGRAAELRPPRVLPTIWSVASRSDRKTTVGTTIGGPSSVAGSRRTSRRTTQALSRRVSAVSDVGMVEEEEVWLWSGTCGLKNIFI